MESSDQDLSDRHNLNFPGQLVEKLLFDKYWSLH